MYYRHHARCVPQSDLRDTELNTLQIGFYHVCGADHSVLRGTEFADYESIFGDAWNHILNAIVTANKYQIGVLLGKLDRNAF